MENQTLQERIEDEMYSTIRDLEGRRLTVIAAMFAVAMAMLTALLLSSSGASAARGALPTSEGDNALPAAGTETAQTATVSLAAGGNLIGWTGLDTTTAAILAGNADIDAIWVFTDGWQGDSTALPAALRPTIVITSGMGMFIVTSAATDLMVPTGSTFNTDVFPFSDPTRDLGDATFTRTLDGVTISADADGLIAGNAYTMWWVIWNDPTQCAVVCGESDLGAPGNVILLAGNGLVASEAGTASFTSHLTVGGPMPDGPIPGALTRPIQATIHLVLRDHGPALTGDALIAQLTTFEATADDAASVGDGFGFDVHAAVSDAPNTPLTAAITAVDDSGVSGSATLRASGDGTAIQVTVAGLTEGDHANHVHHGSCAEQGDIHVPLSDLSAGADGDASGATVWPDNGLDHFASSHYVAVHELVTFAVIACGDVS